MTDVSVIVLGRGYPDCLIDVLQGLGSQNYRPAELIVAVLQPRPFNLPQMPFPVTQMTMATNPPLFGAARNAAAMATSGEVLVFLDQRFTPYPDLVGDYVRSASEFDGLIMGEVVSQPNYIAEYQRPQGKYDDRLSDRLRSGSLPVRKLELQETRVLCSPLNCAILKETFMAVGGFDEQVDAEDVDFGKRLNLAGKQMARINGGIVYHR